MMVSPVMQILSAPIAFAVRRVTSPEVNKIVTISMMMIRLAVHLMKIRMKITYAVDKNENNLCR